MHYFLNFLNRSIETAASNNNPESKRSTMEWVVSLQSNWSYPNHKAQMYKQDFHYSLEKFSEKRTENITSADLEKKLR